MPYIDFETLRDQHKLQLALTQVTDKHGKSTKSVHVSNNDKKIESAHCSKPNCLPSPSSRINSPLLLIGTNQAR